MFINVNHKLDILNCIANLSNDEVFTPPIVVNQMLDLLPKKIWKDSSVTFLDPASKSGIFIREIAKRLIMGLESEIPNLDERLQHIFEKQLYAIPITELSELLSRRTAYCSKMANGKYSIFTNAKSPEGNIKRFALRHDWDKEKCTFCHVTKNSISL